MDPLRDQDNQDFNSAFKVRLSVYKHCPSQVENDSICYS